MNNFISITVESCSSLIHKKGDSVRLNPAYIKWVKLMPSGEYELSHDGCIITTWSVLPMD